MFKSIRHTCHLSCRTVQYIGTINMYSTYAKILHLEDVTWWNRYGFYLHVVKTTFYKGLQRVVDRKYSKSLIIHQVKTKKITTVKEVWIPVLISIDFDDFPSPFTPQFLFRLREYIKHSRQCFISYPNTSNFVKNTPLQVVFSTLFSLCGYPDETLSLVFDILHPCPQATIQLSFFF